MSGRCRRRRASVTDNEGARARSIETFALQKYVSTAINLVLQTAQRRTIAAPYICLIAHSRERQAGWLFVRVERAGELGAEASQLSPLASLRAHLLPAPSVDRPRR